MKDVLDTGSSALDKGIFVGAATISLGWYLVKMILSFTLAAVLCQLDWWFGLSAFALLAAYGRMQWFSHGLHLVFAKRSGGGQLRDTYETAEC